MARRRKRDLSAEEKRLWEHVARHVTPLPGRGGDRAGTSTGTAGAHDDALMHATAPFDARAKLPDVAAVPGRAGADTAPAKSTPPRPALAPYIPPVSRKGETLPAGIGSGGLDRKERRALRRRVRDVDDRLDLHGMRQEEAHRALIRFLQSASARDCAIVLVVTGKGGVGGPGYGDERGVLRRITPHWLRAPELRPFVVGFEEASAHHGGAGALYVRLRRRGR